MTTETLNARSITTKANVYFDGKCVSHSFETAEGEKKSVGVVLASELTFGTAAPEIMECVGGACEYQLEEGGAWQTCTAGQSFKVAGNSKFNIRVAEAFHYICHYG
ncbi:pyrimidine/purine nucleoside phosphorylase [Lampropedia puyangensis]|uniref:Pyrimidine/purine nucleoside phosphorylase n=1 Tax=Lampropedia puyangensis TaxID=1330072 RepID=A0A4S8FAG1_9BURK|nr:pyrimidine/purine nucleoside phosphorylase [Lampropedia puyangensis]THU04011.1 pyrimidine/purine nucleoside phosphorylase [Lampropedia puyangensis]